MLGTPSDVPYSRASHRSLPSVSLFFFTASTPSLNVDDVELSCSNTVYYFPNLLLAMAARERYLDGDTLAPTLTTGTIIPQFAPYGGFPSEKDPFHFIPCVNASLLPPLMHG